MNLLDNLGVRVYADTGKYNQQLRNVEKRTDQAGRRMSGSFDRVRESSQRLQNAMRGLVGAVAAFGGANVISGLVKTNAEFQDLRNTLETLEGSASGGREALGFIQDWAAKTPFDLKSATQAYIRLNNAGIEPTTQLLNTLGNTASVTTSKLDGFHALIRVISRSKHSIGLEDINQLEDRGIPVLTILNEKLGLTRTEITKLGMSAEGAQTIVNAMLEGFNERYTGQMDRAMGNISTTLSNLADNATKVQVAFGDGGFTKVFTENAKALSDFLENITPVAEGLGKIVTAVDWLNKNLPNPVKTVSAALELGSMPFKETEFAQGTGHSGGIGENPYRVGLPTSKPGISMILPSSKPERGIGDLPGLGGDTEDEPVKKVIRSFREYEQTMSQVEILNEKLRGSFDKLGDSIGDTFADALIDGKLNMDTLASVGKQFVSTMISEFLKFSIIQPLIGSIFGGGAAGNRLSASGLPGQEAGRALPHFERGGRVSPGMPIMVGEKGMEVFKPDSSGSIIPNGKSMGRMSQPIVINQTLNVDGNVEGIEEKFAAVMPQLARMSIDAYNDDRSRGGVSALVR